jgi:plastocyanin
MRRLACALAACTYLPLACGGDDEPGARTRAVTVAADKGVRVSAREYSFDPAKVVVTGGPARLRITLANRGSLAHNMKVEQGAAQLGGTPTFPGAQTHSGTVSVKPGRYRLVCTVGDHEQLGMHASLEVRR